MRKIIKRLISLWRAPLRNRYNRILRDKNFVIISSNCLAGVMYHDAKMRFISPTINLSIPNFLDFVDNLLVNLSSDIIPSGFDSLGRPLCRVNGILIKGHHYSSQDELVKKWTERSKRALPFSKIYIVATDEFVRSDEDERRFDLITFPKVCFVSKKPKYDWQIYLPEFKKNSYVLDCMKYKTITGKRIFEKHFNYALWIKNNYN